MEFKNKKKLREAIRHLADANKIHQKSNLDKELSFLMLAKAFEVAVEYFWRELKLAVQDEGLEAPSPKEAIRQAAKIGIIKDPEFWLSCINARNDSVHDYFGIPPEDYTDLCGEFLKRIKILTD